MCAFSQLSFSSLSLGDSGHELLQLTLQLLPLVLRFYLGLLQAFHLTGQLLVGALLALLGLFEVSLKLDKKKEPIKIQEVMLASC